MTIEEALNYYPLDWCFQGAISNPKMHWSVKAKMFIWIFIQYARVLQEKKELSFYKNESTGLLIFEFKKGMLTDWDNEAINTLKYKRRLYKCIIPILEEHFMNCKIEGIWEFKPYINRDLQTVRVYCIPKL